MSIPPNHVKKMVKKKGGGRVGQLPVDQAHGAAPKTGNQGHLSKKEGSQALSILENLESLVCYRYISQLKNTQMLWSITSDWCWGAKYKQREKHEDILLSKAKKQENMPKDGIYSFFFFISLFYFFSLFWFLAFKEIAIKSLAEGWGCSTVHSFTKLSTAKRRAASGKYEEKKEGALRIYSNKQAYVLILEVPKGRRNREGKKKFHK